MLGKIFVALCELPGLKKRLWRTWYNYLARSHRAAEWTFMNYGFADSTWEWSPLEAVDEADRHCIQLYAQVAGAVSLEGAKVLEVGSGRGGGASFIKRYLGPGQVIGVDLSATAVDFSKERHAIDGLEFRVGDAEHLPFEDASFDAVVNVESSHCYPSFARFLAEVRRVLKPGGHFLHADFREQGNVDRWRAALTASGLQLVGEADITPNVVLALERDDERKRALIERLIPGLLRRPFFDFAAVRGSSLYQSFRSGAVVYRSFVLQRPA